MVTGHALSGQGRCTKVTIDVSLWIWMGGNIFGLFAASRLTGGALQLLCVRLGDGRWQLEILHELQPGWEHVEAAVAIVSGLLL